MLTRADVSRRDLPDYRAETDSARVDALCGWTDDAPTGVHAGELRVFGQRWNDYIRGMGSDLRRSLYQSALEFETTEKAAAYFDQISRNCKAAAGKNGTLKFGWKYFRRVESLGCTKGGTCEKVSYVLTRGPLMLTMTFAEVSSGPHHESPQKTWQRADRYFATITGRIHD
ncbi:hypothetical protein [Actinomadura rayongensis]|uniref:Uncharacterized protein n=1 Tax=Actinomadura rayongensis TaxID=1429076 RepID=A0A6I4W8Z7_9ACTN|nr:hypothetical protein [Actinomadura rayongensis]MXQ65280.1 hypothetical protein [Actinomadura rayongensis]